MVTRAATKANAIANRMRQIRDRSNPATRARSASRVADLLGRVCAVSAFTTTIVKELGARSSIERT